MKILIAKESGFCFGVKRASSLALASPKNAFTLGPLIHNPEFTKYLESKGIFIAKKLKDIKGKKIVIRSHGIPKELENKLKKEKFQIIDATCPFVKRVQKEAELLEKQGYKVLILGEKNHPEILGIQSYAPESKAIKNLKEIPNFKKQDKIGFVSQTTQSLDLFKKISAVLKKKYKKVKIINTICDATEKRQGAARQLACTVDIMIVIGGKDSSNTTRLKEICGGLTRTYHIESERELKKDWFKEVKLIGITAGASTPDFSIKEVIKRIKQYDEKSS